MVEPLSIFNHALRDIHAIARLEATGEGPCQTSDATPKVEYTIRIDVKVEPLHSFHHGRDFSFAREKEIINIPATMLKTGIR
jgi:hypothetical protein